MQIQVTDWSEFLLVYSVITETNLYIQGDRERNTHNSTFMGKAPVQTACSLPFFKESLAEWQSDPLGKGQAKSKAHYGKSRGGYSQRVFRFYIVLCRQKYSGTISNGLYIDFEFFAFTQQRIARVQLPQQPGRFE
ncbi:hypothetical protein XELAEV_18017837mg [Xenopus laevis]|uniref:Uncharacterized protein n=1 Tax=Xenopus laevis TaxID=8355 RepID=A0A974DC70_XENLA|nr:hypothetical protein XELAEV_18017837mg [Xenopus laevis]